MVISNSSSWSLDGWHHVVRALFLHNYEPSSDSAYVQKWTNFKTSILGSKNSASKFLHNRWRIRPRVTLSYQRKMLRVQSLTSTIHLVSTLANWFKKSMRVALDSGLPENLHISIVIRCKQRHAASALFIFKRPQWQISCKRFPQRMTRAISASFL